MPYSKLAREIRNRSGLTTESVSLVLREFVDYLLYELRQGKTVSLPGLGAFRNVYQKPKKTVCNLPGRNQGRVYYSPVRIRPFLVPSPTIVREESYTLPKETDHPVETSRDRLRRWMRDVCEPGR